MTIDTIGRLSRIEADLIRHVQSYTGDIWYVTKTGNDGNSGHDPENPFLTIGAAIAAASAGDAITIKTGTYTEDIDVNLTGLELWGEIGTTVAGTLTVSANSCRISEIIVAPTGAVGIALSGSYCKIQDTHVVSTPTTAFDISGAYNIIVDCKAVGHTVTAFDIAGTRVYLHRCLAHGTGGATRGFYFSDAGANVCAVEDCSSMANATAGFEVVTGAENILFTRCSSGGGDGDRVDDGTRTFWPGFTDRRRREAHEHVYPASTGEGAAGDPVTVNNSTTDGVGGVRQDQNYWGDVAVVVAPTLLASDWDCLGVYIHGNTAADIQQWQTFFTSPNYEADQNGGNDWDENETVLTVDDGSLFQTDDFVWITGTDRPAGEILKVASVAGNAVTIVRETTADGEAGLRYDYDGAPGANKMYLVYRPADREFHGYDGDFEIDTTRAGVRLDFVRHKRIEANGGMIIRMLNATDGAASSFDVRVIYMD